MPMAKKPEKIKMPKKEATPSFFRAHFFEIIIAGFCLLLYSNSLFNGYNMDDELVTRNHRLTSKGISAIPEIFTSPYYKDEMGYAYEYRPVVLASFAIEHSLFGDKPFVSHLINLLLYALLCVSLYKALLKISKQFTPLFSFAATLLFAAHTSHTEVVDSIKNRDEILGLIFCLLTIIVAFKSIQPGKKIWLLLLPLVFALALMNKITFLSFAVIIPFALLMFTEINFLSVITVSILLSLPVFFLLNLPDLARKVEIISGLIAGGLLTYLVLRLNLIMEGLRAITSSAFRKHEPVEIKNIENESWKDFFKNAVPPKDYFSLAPAFVTLFLVCTLVGGILFIQPIISIVSVFLLIALVFIGSEKWSWWANTLLILFLALSILHHPFPYKDEFYYAVLNLVLSYFVFFGKKQLRIPATIALLFVIVHMPSEVDDHLAFITPLVISSMRLKKWRLRILLLCSLVSIIFLSAWAISHSFSSIFPVLYGVASFTKWANNIFSILAVFLLYTLYIGKGHKITAWLYTGFAFALLLSLAGKGNLPYLSPLPGARDKVVAIGKTVNTNVLQEKLDRPIHFVEQPISFYADWQTKTGTSLHILLHYFTKTILPYPLAFYYGYKFIAPEKITEFLPIISLLIHLILFGVCVCFLKHNPFISFGIGCYLISLLPFTNYFMPIPGIVGDRYMLIPSIGWSILLMSILFKIGKVNDQSTNPSGPKDVFQLSPIFKYSFAGILCLYSLLTFSRNFDWKDDLTLMQKDIKYVTNSSQAHNLLAVHLMKSSFDMNDAAEQQKIRIDAIAHFKSAIEIYPPFYNVAFDLGRSYATLNIPDSAIVYFKRAIAIDSTNSDAHLFVAKLLVESKRNDEAIPYFESRIGKTPDDYSSYETLSYIYFTLKEYEKSIAVNTVAVKRFPTLVDPLVNISRAFIAANKNDSAKIYLQRALVVSPNNTVSMQLLQQVMEVRPSK